MFYYYGLFRNSLSTLNVQSVRWIRPRKPFWKGMAKSKMFKPYKAKSAPVEETDEKKKIIFKYKLQMDSFLEFIQKENPLLFFDKSKSINELKMTLEKDIVKSYEENETWNAECKKLREERLKLEEEIKIQAALKKISKEDEKTQMIQKRAEEIVKEEKILRPTFITLENLNEAVENCLSSISEHNFAIQVSGERITGRETYRNTNSELLQKKEKFTEV